MEDPAQATDVKKSDRVVNEMVLRKNLATVNFVRSCMGALSGIAAGSMGLTGWAGFGFYVLTFFAVSALLMSKAAFKPEEYFKTRLALLTDGLLGGLLSYILFWTLAYALVFIY